MWIPFTVVDANHCDATIYPVLSEPEAPFPFAWEQADGHQPSAFQTKVVSVLAGRRPRATERGS